ncbi:MAG: cardiolipin synthase, partial [Saprospiraceae bacterium]|nr:cardiolipin synthase [Saprospiraceae bacterium]
LQNGPPSRTIAWIFMILFFPFIGLLSFSVFGQSYRKERIFSKKQESDAAYMQNYLLDKGALIPSQSIVDHGTFKRNEQIIKLLSHHKQGFLTSGNRITFFEEGDETFSEQEKALLAAKKSIHLQYYIVDQGKVLDRMIAILEEKVRNGVEVRFIIDGLGSRKLEPRFIRSIRKKGIECEIFLPVKIGIFPNRINYRNHRKIIVIDGKVGFTGGINISDKYLRDEELGTWKDSHVRIEGPAVGSLQLIFLADWHFLSRQNLDPKKYIDTQSHADGVPVQVISSGPDTRFKHIKGEYFVLITNATKYVYIATPYFLPSEAIQMALVTSAMAGVDVRLYLPKKADLSFVTYSLGTYLEELLIAGVKVFLFEAGFIHSKMVLVDDEVLSIGTANLDERSLEHNFEVNAVVYDQNLSLSLKEQFESYERQSVQINLEEFQSRPLITKILEAIAKIFSPLL